MQRFTTFAVCFLLAGALTVCPAASPSIGMVVSRGGFQVDNARVSGNATLFDGTVIQTGRATGDVELNTGIRMQLASESRGRVFHDRLVLEQGVGQLNGSGYQIEARTLRIAADEAYGSGRVALTGTSRVTVSAVTGHLRVTNSQGLLVASLLPGAALEFEPQANGSLVSKLTGTLRKQGGKFFLTDETTQVTVEVRGTGLDAHVGKRVEVNGTSDPAAKPTEPATQVVTADNVTRLDKSKGKALAGAGAGAAGAGAAGAGAAGAATGIGVGTTVAIVGGVAAAGTIAGLGVTGSLPGQGNDSSTNSSR